MPYTCKRTRHPQCQETNLRYKDEFSSREIAVLACHCNGDSTQARYRDSVDKRNGCAISASAKSLKVLRAASGSPPQIHNDLMHLRIKKAIAPARIVFATEFPLTSAIEGIRRRYSILQNFVDQGKPFALMLQCRALKVYQRTPRNA